MTENVRVCSLGKFMFRARIGLIREITRGDQENILSAFAPSICWGNRNFKVSDRFRERE